MASSVQGEIGHDSADTGAPVKIGGKAAGVAPAAVAAADRVNAWLDLSGRLVVRENYPSEWQEDSVGTTAGVTLSHAASAGNIHKVSAIQCSSDTAAAVTVESPAGTVLYTKRFAGAFTLSETFPIPLSGADGALVQVKISLSTTNCEANMQGYTVPSS